jgi:hypothetical protein
MLDAKVQVQASEKPVPKANLGLNATIIKREKLMIFLF